MYFRADLHLHSRYSRATSRDLQLEHLSIWARRKGLTLLGTGDFTHPEWFNELREKLIPAEAGLFRLKPHLEELVFQQDPLLQGAEPTRFMLTTEVGTTYKKNGKTRKNHHLICLPDFEAVEKLVQRLGPYGALQTEGRPSLELDARDLLELVLEVGEGAHLIPAHIWSPWFSLFGGRGGFDSVEECFEDLSKHIFALETGLASNPEMNWRLSSLDRFALLSNSDAHSPSRLGRKANLFDTELDYFSIFDAIKKRDNSQFVGTIELHPAGGKNFFDGHRACQLCYAPSETIELKGICPACKTPLTLGVMHRLEELADRPSGFIPESAPEAIHLIPLEDLLSELLEVSPKSKKVQRHYQQILARFGPELPLLHTLPLEDLKYGELPMLIEAIRRLRQGQLYVIPGFDGRYGHVTIFEEGEPKYAQQRLFPSSAIPRAARQMTLFDFLEAPKRPQSLPAAPQLSLFGQLPTANDSQTDPNQDEISTATQPEEEPSNKTTLGVSTAAPSPEDDATPGTSEFDESDHRAIVERFRDQHALSESSRHSQSTNQNASGTSQQTTSQDASKIIKFPQPTQQRLTPVPSSDERANSTSPIRHLQTEQTQKKSREERPTPHLPLQRSPQTRPRPNRRRAPFAKYVLPPPKQVLSPLNIEQRAPVKHWGTSLLISAGPGTGKTFALSTRIAYLIVSQVLHPTHILALTFSNKAARQMSDLLDQTLGLYRGVTIGTFHRFCLNLLQEEEQICRLLGEAERMTLMRELSQQRGFSSKPAEHRQILDRISYAKQKLMGPENVDFPGLDERFVILYRDYQKWLKQEQLYDLDDLLFESVRLLQHNPSLCHQLQLRFRSIHVDEYQDLNEAQYQLLRLLVSPKNDLCVAGDIDQSIYGYRGANLQHFRDFERDFSWPGRPARRYSLWRNYRSPECIVDAAHALISEQSNTRRIAQTSIFSGLDHIELSTAQNEQLEAHTVTQKILSLIEGKSDLSDFNNHNSEPLNDAITFADIALIYASNEQLPPLQRALKRAGIPYRISHPIGIAEKLPELKLLLALLRYLSPPEGDWLALYELFSLWPTLEGLSMSKVQHLQQQNPSLTPHTFMERVGQWLDFRTEQAEQVSLLAAFLKQLHAVSTTASAKEFIEFTFERMRELLPEPLVPGNETRTLLYERAAATPLFIEFLQRLLLEEDPDPYIQPADRISLCSLRATKGLEFPVVFMLGCEERFYPGPNRSPEEEEEAHRQFYVGMTRAQKQLYFSRCETRLLDNQRLPSSPSPYLGPLAPFIKEVNVDEDIVYQEDEPPQTPQQELFVKID